MEVMNALELHFKKDTGETEAILWFDCFCVNQHKNSGKTTQWWIGTFKNAIKGIGRLVMVVFPWDKPMTFERAWCVLEASCAIDTLKDKIEFCLSDKELKKAREALAKNGVKCSLDNVLKNIDVGNCQAGTPQSRQLILNEIEAHHGGTELVNTKFRKEVLNSYFFNVVQ